MVQKIIKVTMSCLIVIGLIPFSFAANDLEKYITSVHKTIADGYNNDNEYTQSKIMLQKLCNSLYTTDTEDIDYDPKQSIFLSVTCTSIAEGTKDENLTNTIKEKTVVNYLKRSNRQDMGLFCPKAQNTLSSEGNCIPEIWDNSIDYNYLFLKTIQNALNDRSNIQTARLYGFQDINEKGGDLANLYLATTFKAMGKTPEVKDYPKTYKEINQYISETKKIIDKLYLVDVKKVKNQSEEVKTKYCLRNNMLLNVGGKKYDGKICKEKDYSDKTSYINSLYNELFFYTLFSSLYEQYLPIFLQTKNENQEPYAVKAFLTQNEKINFIQIQSQEQRNQITLTTQSTIKQLGNLQASFPLHIGLLLYEEDLYDFRKRLATIYLPFHQLHYKLENVQSKE